MKMMVSDGPHLYGHMVLIWAMVSVGSPWEGPRRGSI